MTTHLFRLGAKDWLHPGWTGPLYPSDMPAEWRPAYFNVRFACVWLPHAVWSGLDPAVIDEWLVETREAFRFLLERVDPVSSREQALVERFGDRLGSHCPADHADLLWFDARTDLRELADELRRRTETAGATYVLSRDGDLATIDRVATVLDLLGLGTPAQVG